MSKDQWIPVALVVSILLHVSILIIGLVTRELSYLTTLLNLAAALSIILYWAQKQLRIRQHTLELREIIVLCLETAVIGCALYSITTKQWDTWLRIIQYIVFGIHLSAILFLFVFMLTFKIKRLI